MQPVGRGGRGWRPRGLWLLFWSDKTLKAGGTSRGRGGGAGSCPSGEEIQTELVCRCCSVPDPEMQQGKKGCWEAIQEHSVSAGKSNQMQQECDLLCSERREAWQPGHTRRLQFKLTVTGDRDQSCPELPDAPGGAAPPSSLSWHKWPWRPQEAASLRVQHSVQSGLTRGLGVTD